MLVFPESKNQNLKMCCCHLVPPTMYPTKISDCVLVYYTDIGDEKCIEHI